MTRPELLESLRGLALAVYDELMRRGRIERERLAGVVPEARGDAAALARAVSFLEEVGLVISQGNALRFVSIDDAVRTGGRAASLSLSAVGRGTKEPEALGEAPAVRRYDQPVHAFQDQFFAEV